ncbi:MAG: thiolase family protein [Thiofilum sp.]|uniref:thiolase family protein n=1 Tax=Thiofilum sp. TaxID=2212733 RepID=UPI0025FA0F12|nr:thiolase family protein [Thiofilum sp.]MBK8453686.1 thiolase family protein [Thiofilum sp.]
MKPVVIAGYTRTPFTLAKKGGLVKVRPDDLAAAAVQGLIAKTGIDPNHIEDLQLGCAFPEGEQGLNIARLVVLLAGLPLSIGGVTINRFCGSSMQGIHQAAGAIQLGAGEAFICAGVESMTRVNMGGFNPAPNPKLYANMPGAYMSMGITAENLAKLYNISRAEQEQFAVASHQKAYTAQQAGKLADEIVAVGSVAEDGCIRPETTLETLAGLKLAFDENGTVTAGTSSPLTDGASATLVCSEEFAKAHGLAILARIRSVAISGCAPEIMGIGPVLSTQKALKRAGLTVNDLDIIELNEAFSAQSLACIRDLNLDMNKINLDGGAIALGHPLGATGARITGKAASLLKREGKQFALATQCIGGGQGIATILEAV